MATEIESLQISINAKATTANNAIDKLVARLNVLSTSLGKINNAKTNLTGLASGVERLAKSMQLFKDIKAVDFNKIAKGLEKFNSVNTGNLSSVSVGLEQLSKGLSAISAVQGLDSITRVVNSIKNISTVDMSKFNPAQFEIITKSITNFANSVKSVGKIDSSISNLVNSIARLSSSGKYISNVSTEFPKITTQIVDFATRLNGIRISADLSGLSTLIANIKNLGGKTATNAITNIPLLATALSRLMTTLSRAPSVSKSVINMTNALARLAASGSRVGTASRGISSALARTSTSATRATKRFGGLASIIGRFYASYFLFIRAIKGLGKAINSTADYLEAYNYFNVALGKIGSDWSHQYEQYGYASAESYADSFATRLQEKLSGLSGISIQLDADGTGLLTETGLQNLGLNIKEVTQYASQLSSVTNSVGQTGEVSLATASAFTKLGADLSSLFNLDYADVMGNLQSGLIGQSRALYKYGIDITNATLQTYAYELGLEKAVSEMTQMEKMQLRVLAVLDQSKVSWGDLANTINSPSNMMRQFSNNAKELGMVFGQLLTPALQKIMPILNGLTIAFKRLFVSIANLLGIKLDLSSFGQGYSGIEEEMEDVADSFDDATASAKKFKTYTLGIDELNIQPEQAESGGSGGGGGVGEQIDLTDEILQATEEYEKVWQEAFDKMENTAQQWADKIQEFFEPISEPFEKFLSNLSMEGWTQAGMYAGETVAAIFDKVSDVLEEVDWDEIGNSIGLFLKGIEWTKIFSSVGNFLETAINSAIDLWKGAFKADPIATTIVTALAVAKFTGLGAVLASKIAAALPTGLTIAITAIIGFELGKGLGMLLNPEDSEWYNNFKFFGEDGFFKTITKDIEATLEAWSALTNDWENNPIIASLGTFFVGGLKKVDPPPAETLKQAFEEGKIAALEKFAEIGEAIGTWFTEDVQPWFMAEKWNELFENAKIGLQTKWDEIVEWWQTTAIGKWFEEDVMPWFGKEKWDEVLSSIPSSFKQAFFNGVTSAISFINKLIDGIESMINSAIDGFAKLVDALNPFSEFMDSKGISFNVNHIDLPNIAIPQYQTGGFPEDGLFMANRNELVGQFSNGRTVVANNEMIVSGIEGGVERAVARVLAPYLADIAQNTRETADKDMSVNIGDREIAKANARGSKALGYALIY